MKAQVQQCIYGDNNMIKMDVWPLVLKGDILWKKVHSNPLLMQKGKYHKRNFLTISICTSYN